MSSSSIASACVSFPGPEQSCSTACRPRRSRIASSAGDRLERADQHGRADALRLADRVDERVDAVGAVDVGGAGRAEEDVRARGHADVGVAGRLGLVVGLGLDDHARRAPVRQRAADEVAARPRRPAGRRTPPAAPRPTPAGPRAPRARGSAARARARAPCRPRRPSTRARTAGRARRRTRRRAPRSGARARRA